MKMAKRRVSKTMEPTVNESLLVCKIFKEEEKRFKSNGDEDTILLNNKEDQLKSAQVEMGEVREENERLKLVLSKIMKEYQSLQMHFHANVDRTEQAKESPSIAPPTNEVSEESEELVSLSLGRDSSVEQLKKDIEKKISNPSKDEENDEFDGGLELGLGCKFNPCGSMEVSKNPTSPENRFGEEKEQEGNEKWSPGRSLKTVRSGDDDVHLQNNLKKARVSVRAVCDTPTMNDGCQWRKYGQKIAKGNPCPRAYYRCTISASCPVRKQVQRCADNKSILITTYEGTHNHSLPASAAAMASATSAAAAMLRSPSSTSQPLPGNPTPTTASAAVANLHGLNFTLTTNGPTPHPPFYFPNSSLSTSHSHPTITLDLTAPPPAAASHFTRLTPNFPSLPRFSSTCLNFSSSSSSSSPSFSWGHGYLGYGTVLPGNRTHVGSSYYRNDLLMNHQNAPPPPLPSLTETVDTATKAITSNPDFRSALQAAITSFVGNRGAVERENQGGGPNSGENAKWGYLSGLPSVISRQGRSSLLPSSSLQISTSQSSSLSSPADKVDRMK